MGVVFKALDVALNRVVALKMILAGPGAGGKQLARFRAEAEALARLQHPHIVQVFASGWHDGQPYFALEFVAGGSLDRRLGGEPQPPRDAARLVLLLARAVHAAHRAGLVHRDLKPANVLLGPPADEPALNCTYGCPKVTDFGLAKHFDLAETSPEAAAPGSSGSHTLTGGVIGTPAYMAPEQAAGRADAVGPATDVYALGVILYELLTGRPPFKGLTPLATLDHVRTRPPVRPSALQPDLPDALEVVCLRCLEKAPRDRYATAADLADALQAFLAGQAPPRPARSRRRRAVTLALLAAAAVAAITGAVLWEWWGSSPEPTPAVQGPGVVASPAARPEEKAPAAPKPPAGWKEYRNPTGNYALWLPGVPSERTRTVTT